jgi:hypothetical protein
MLLGCGCGGILEQVTAFVACVDLSTLVAWASSWVETVFGGGRE